MTEDSAHNFDEKMIEDDTPKQLTLVEYEAEFNNKLAREIATFQKSLLLIVKVPQLSNLIVDICREVETPFISLDGFNFLEESELKTQLTYL